MPRFSTPNDLNSFVSQKEDYYFDRKSARKDDKEISRHISAFANASGGKLVIGIEDNGEVTGFKRDGARPIEAFEQCSLTECEPCPQVSHERIPVVNSKGQQDSILAIDVDPSVDRVIKRKSDGAVFLRQDGSSNKMNHEQITALEYDKNQRSFEEEIVSRSSIEDIDSEVMQKYREVLGSDASDEQILRSRGLLVDGHLTKAGVLLFGKEPTRFLPSARVRFVRIDGTKMTTGQRLNIIKDQTIEGPLPKIIEEARSVVASQLRDFQYLSDEGVFVTVPEYPEFAWFEGIVNAVTHRNYAISGDYTLITMYDDRLEIKSPGKLPNIVTLDNMMNTRYSRNPGIARVLAEMGWVRELNEGVKRIYDEMRRFFLKDPIYEEPNDIAVMLTLENNIIARRLRSDEAFRKYVEGDAIEDLSAEEISALQFAYMHGNITTRQLAFLLRRGNTYASKLLKGLTRKDLLVWHGNSTTDPSQHYTLK